MVRLEPTHLLFLVCISIQYSSCKDLTAVLQFQFNFFSCKTYHSIVKLKDEELTLKVDNSHYSILLVSHVTMSISTFPIEMIKTIFIMTDLSSNQKPTGIEFHNSSRSIRGSCRFRAIFTTKFACHLHKSTAKTVKYKSNPICPIKDNSYLTSEIPTTPTLETSTNAPTTPTPESVKMKTCYSGWMNVNDSCYRIINEKRARDEATYSCDGDSILATKIPEELSENIGYNGTVWLNESGQIRACNLGDPSTCKSTGKYNSLCSRKMLNDSITLSGPARFFEASSWMIPNTERALEIIKEQYSNCCISDGIWIGLYKSCKRLYWIDNSLVSETEKALLNISDSLSDGNCAMYNGSISFTSCSARKIGLRTPLLRRPCFCSHPRRNISHEQFKKGLKEMAVIKKDTSKYKRSKTSAPDERTSSKVIGLIAGLTIAIPFTVLIISDIPILAYQIIETFKNFRERFK